jgi:hypothetical protein
MIPICTLYSLQGFASDAEARAFGQALAARFVTVYADLMAEAGAAAGLEVTGVFAPTPVTIQLPT